MPMAVVGGVIAGVGAIGAAAISSKAAKSAAKTAAAAQEKATDSSLQIARIQEQLFRDIHKDGVKTHTPYLESGYGAQAVLNQLLGLKPLTADQFNKGEWFTPGKVDYSVPAQVTAQPAPAPVPASTNVAPNLQEQAIAAINAGADPLMVQARMAVLPRFGMGLEGAQIQ